MKRCRIAALIFTLCACTGNVDGEGDQPPAVSNSGGSTASGGSAGGGQLGSGGMASGGMTTGGDGVTGGSATGGASTGGSVTGGSATGGSGSGGQTTGGTFVPDPTKAGVFMVQGHVGRLMMTCDDGDSFIVDENRDENLICFQGVDCDHASHSGRGIQYGDGQFVATFGWGTPGAVVRSVDGRNWTPVTSGTTFANVAFGNGVWLGNDYIPFRSQDGQTWSENAAAVHYDGTPRAIVYSAAQGGRFVLYADGPTIFYSADNGVTFTRATSAGSGCGNHAAAGNGVVLFAGSSTACRSADGGDNFSEVSLGRDTSSNLVFHDGTFMKWGPGVRLTSSDGQSWQSTNVTPENLALSGVAVSDTGTYLGYVSQWDAYYDRARFYRSSDGVTWTETADASAAAGHPLQHIAFGYLDRSVCE